MPRSLIRRISGIGVIVIVMIIIIGLGNPGKKFKNTRHNLGFKVIDKFAEKNNFPQFKLSQKFKALISKGILNSKEIILAKPQTFMNNSGTAVQLLVTGYGLPVTDLIITHDDLDLLTGDLKITQNRGAGGHNGVQSIINSLETKNFIRLRLGIGHERGTPDKKKYVLGKFTQQERKAVEQLKQQAVQALEMILNQGIEKAMSKFN